MSAVPKNNLAQLRKMGQSSTASSSQPPASSATDHTEGKSKNFRFKPASKVEPIGILSPNPSLEDSDRDPVAPSLSASTSSRPTPSFTPSTSTQHKPPPAAQAGPSRLNPSANKPARAHKRSSSEFQPPTPEPSKRVKQEINDGEDQMDWELADQMEQQLPPRSSVPPPAPLSRNTSHTSKFFAPAPSSAPPPPPPQPPSSGRHIDLLQRTLQELQDMERNVMEKRLANLELLNGIKDGKVFGEDEVLLKTIDSSLKERHDAIKAELARRRNGDGPPTGHVPRLPPNPPPSRQGTESTLVPDRPTASHQPDVFDSPAFARPRDPMSRVNQGSSGASLTSSTDVSFRTAPTSILANSTGTNPGPSRRNNMTDDEEEKMWAMFDGPEDDEPIEYQPEPGPSRPLRQIENVDSPPRLRRSPRKRPGAPVESPSVRSVISINSSPGVPSPRKKTKDKGKGKAKEIPEDDGVQAALKKSPYYPEIMKVLKDTFKLTSFRPNQLEAVTGTLNGRDVFVLMPTGGGKSLCYQVPAICKTGRTSGITIVVSPLKSLMTDQVEHLLKLGVDVVSFSGDASAEDARETRSRLRSRNNLPAILYVTPEKLEKSDDTREILLWLYQQGLIARFVIDEAHCVSTWGRDFRDSYQNLDRLRQDYPNTPIMALTATANEKTVHDIITRLGMKNPVKLKQSFNRSNLFYDVREKKGKNVVADIFEFIQTKHSGDCGVIYCLSRAKCEEVAKELREKYGLKAKHYHAHMNAEDKKATQAEWQRGRCDIIVATIAFGMGIDKPNVRFVIHHTLPKTLNGLYQETGRAGRDGLPADCILYYAFADTNSLNSMIDKSEINGVRLAPAEIARQKEELKHVVQYCQNSTDCRRALVLAYFGEQFPPSECNMMCNNCIQNDGSVEEDMSAPAKDALRLIQKIVSRDRATLIQVMDVFRGSQKKEIKEKGWNSLDGAGKGADMDRDQTDRLFNHLLSQEALAYQTVANKQGWHQNYLAMGPRANDILSGRMRLMMMVPKRKGTAKKPASTRTVRKAVVSKTTRTVTEEEREIITEIEVDDDYRPDPDDPIEEDERPASRQTRSRKKRDPYADDIEDDDDHAPVRRAAIFGANKSPEVRCYEAFQALRTKIMKEEGHKEPERILPDYVMQLISLSRPQDVPAFKAKLREALEDPEEAKTKWAAYGKRFFEVSMGQTLGISAPSPPPSPPSSRTTHKSRPSFDTRQLHEKFDYKASTSSTSYEASASASTSSSKPKSKGGFRPATSGAQRPVGKSTGWIKAMPVTKK